MNVSISCQVPLGSGFGQVTQQQARALKEKGYLGQVLSPEEVPINYASDPITKDNAFDSVASLMLEQCDALHSTAHAALYLFARAKFLKAKCVLERGSMHIKEQDDILSKAGVPIHPLIVRRQECEYELADYIYVSSTLVEESFKKYGLGDKIVRNPLGVDTKRFAPVINPCFSGFPSGTKQFQNSCV